MYSHQELHPNLRELPRTKSMTLDTLRSRTLTDGVDFSYLEKLGIKFSDTQSGVSIDIPQKYLPHLIEKDNTLHKVDARITITSNTNEWQMYRVGTTIYMSSKNSDGSTQTIIIHPEGILSSDTLRRLMTIDTAMHNMPRLMPIPPLQMHGRPSNPPVFDTIPGSTSTITPRILTKKPTPSNPSKPREQVPTSGNFALSREGFIQVGQSRGLSEAESQTVQRMMLAIAKKESRGNYNTTGQKLNSGSHKGDRAIGRYQIMPRNWKAWGQEYFGNPNMENTAENQDKIAFARMCHYYQKYQRGRTEDQIFLEVSALWYGRGRAQLPGHPTTAQYQSQALALYNQTAILV